MAKPGLASAKVATKVTARIAATTATAMSTVAIADTAFLVL